MIAIPWDSLEADVLDKLLEEIVTREGTDYGAVEKTTDQKCLRARHQLEAGSAVLVWDAHTQSASLVSRDEAVQHQLI